MNADEIRAITKGWTGTLVTWFMDFDNDAHSQRRCAYYDSGVHGLDGLLERGWRRRTRRGTSTRSPNGASTSWTA